MTLAEVLVIGIAIGFVLGLLADRYLIRSSGIAPRLLHRFVVWRDGAP